MQALCDKLVYGGIVNCHTKEELEFNELPVPETLALLLTLPGTTYGVDWEYAGDLTAQDSDANIFVCGVVDGSANTFDGETAVADFIARFSDDYESEQYKAGRVYGDWWISTGGNLECDCPESWSDEKCNGFADRLRLERDKGKTK